jgi:ABC-type amino acid transport substrate-binding protein
MRDPNTGQFSGITYDFMQEVGKSMNIKVEYSMEVPWDSAAVALQTGKADAHCAGIWATPSRGKSFVVPVVRPYQWQQQK